MKAGTLYTMCLDLFSPLQIAVNLSVPLSPHHLCWPALCILRNQEVNVRNTVPDLLFHNTNFFLFFFFFAFLQKNIMVMNKNLGCMVLLPLFFVRRRKRGSELLTGNPLKLELVHNLLLTTLDWSADYFQFARAQVWWSDVEIMYLTW